MSLVEGPEAVAAAREGDDSAFTALVERYRRELHVHCYRMLGSYQEAEDLVQETFLRAWRKRETFEGRSTFRAWLYKIATNACLDFLSHSSRRLLARRVERVTDSGVTLLSPSEVPWLEPYPDRFLEELAPSDTEPDAAVVAKETIELAFLVAIQHLPPRPRAVLILRDVLRWSAKETAELLEASVASVNSALQRARATLKEHRSTDRPHVASSAPSEEERALLQRYMDATERKDVAGFAALLRQDAWQTMPPDPAVYHGRAAIAALFDVFVRPGGEFFEAEKRCVSTRANMQPAVAIYLRRPGDTEFRAMALDVLEFEDGEVSEITTFVPELFSAFGLPAVL